MNMTASFKIAAGVRADFENLLRRFQKTKCVRFEEFTQIWKDMKFSYIFSGHENAIELLTFTDECLNIAFSYCLPPHSFQWKTGGIYLLYSIYFKQPNLQKVKIRVTASQWKHILDFIQEVVEQQHHDIHFIYWKLRQFNAFYFVAFPKQMAPYLKSKTDADGSRCFLESSALKDMIDEDYCTPLEEIHQNYLATKMELYPNDPSLSMVQEDLFSVIVKKIDAFENTRLKVVDGYLNEMGEQNYNDYADEESEPKDIGSRRAKLKKSLISKKATTTQSRRHRVVEGESSDTSPEKQRATNKKGRKKRKINSQNNSSDEEMEDDVLQFHIAHEDESMECRLSMPSFQE